MINELTLLNKMPNNAIRYAENIEMIILDQKKKNLRI